jgi:cell cycle arrest protein BUB2
MKLLRSFPPLDARKIIMVATDMAAQIPDDLYTELVNHLKPTASQNPGGSD